MRGDGTSIARFWADKDLESGVPTSGRMDLRNASGIFQIGGFQYDGTSLDFATSIYVQDNGTGQFASGNVTRLSVRDISLELVTFLKDRKAAKKLHGKLTAEVEKLKAKVKDARKAAKAKKVKPADFPPFVRATGDLKKTGKKLGKVEKLLMDLMEPF